MKRGTQSVIGCVMGLVALATAVGTQTPAQGPPSVRVSAHATVQAMPDQAEVDVGVVTRAPTSQRASSQNAAQLDAVRRRLRALLGRDARIRSVAFSARPDDKDPKPGEEPTTAGYTATNIVHVTLSDLARLADVIDAAVGAGANRVEGVRVSLQNEAASRSQAVRQAAADARSQAETLASALGVRTVRLLAASEDTGPVLPFGGRSPIASATVKQPTTPVEVGPIEINATVTITGEVRAVPAGA